MPTNGAVENFNNRTDDAKKSHQFEGAGSVDTSAHKTQKTTEDMIMENDSNSKNVLHFQDLILSISEWCPFGQNAISSFNESIDSLKGIKSSLLTGTIDEAPSTSEFTILPKFTRVRLEDFDRYNWIKFKAFVEYPELVEQIEEVGTHVDRSGFINYGLKLETIEDKASRFAVDDVAVILADLIEDTSTMMEALLTQFQRRILRMINGETPFRPKFTIALTSALLPEHDSVMNYKDGEKQQSEIDQIIGISYKYWLFSTFRKEFITSSPRKSEIFSL